MKIRIVGGSGTGKTTLAKELSVKYGIANYDLDDIFWDNNSQTVGNGLKQAKSIRWQQHFLQPKQEI